MKKLFVDTSAWIAYFSSTDEFHSEAKKIFSLRPTMHTSNVVLHETIAHLAARVSKKAAHIAGETIINSGIVEMFLVQYSDEQSSWALSKKFNHKLSFVDITNIVIMQREKIDTIFTFDSDFKQFDVDIIPTL